jgi:hypothetical protein
MISLDYEIGEISTMISEHVFGETSVVSGKVGIHGKKRQPKAIFGSQKCLCLSLGLFSSVLCFNFGLCSSKELLEVFLVF